MPADPVTARLVAEHRGLDLDRLTPSALGAVPRFRLVDDVVERLDASLHVVARRPSGLPRETRRLLAVGPDLPIVVGAGESDLAVAVGEDLVHWVELPQADSAVLVTPTRLLVTGPVDGPHRVVLIDLGTGAVLDETIVEVFDAGMSATPHPTDGSVVLDAGEGQDGSQVFVVRIDGDGERLVVEKKAEDVVVSGFDSTGERLLITPHPNLADRVAVLAWPSLDVLAEAYHDELGCVPDFYGCFVDDDCILLRTYDDGGGGLRRPAGGTAAASRLRHARALRRRGGGEHHGHRCRPVRRCSLAWRQVASDGLVARTRRLSVRCQASQRCDAFDLLDQRVQAFDGAVGVAGG